jgi:aerobic-type carbon monoxide dehydrogenase small subunit (CoxS/CutS family)
MRKTLVVNGSSHAVDVRPGERLLSVLREQLGLTGTKEGCSVGDCGACTVVIGDVPHLSCVTLATTVGDPVLTVEGLAEVAAALLEAFAEEGGFQCGFCTPGQLLTAHCIIQRASGEHADDEEIRRQLAGNICRCTGYTGIVRAIRRAAQARQPEEQ